MAERPNSTNIPDYQKLRQTSQAIGTWESSSDWNQEVEILTPSPIIREPKCLQPEYHSSGYGNSTFGGSFAHKEEPTYLPEGCTRPGTKYINAFGVECNIVGRPVSTISVSQHNNPEGLLVSNSSFCYPFHNAQLTTSSSAKALYLSNFNGTSRELNALEDKQKNNSMVHHHRKDRNEVIGVPVFLKTSQEDLRHWQHQHQEELLHQHLETQALYESPASQLHQVQGPNDSILSKLNIQDDPPARWEPVRRAADNIIREKNMIIDKLKNRILELEEDLKSSESKLQQSLITNQDDNNLVHLKFQEMCHTNSTLKEKINEERSNKDIEITDLEIKLGTADHEVQKLKELIHQKDTDISILQAQNSEKIQEAASLHQQYENSCNSQQKMKKKLECLQRYLSDLPTEDESRLQSKEIQTLRLDNVALNGKIESCEKKLYQAKKIITTRDFHIRELEEGKKLLDNKICALKQDLNLLQDTDGSNLHKAQEEVQALQTDKEKLSNDLEKAKKLLEMTHHKLRHIETKSQQELAHLKERTTLDAEVIDSLRAEVGLKEEQIKKMTRSIKKLGNESQDLLQQGLVAKEYVRQLQADNTEAVASQQFHLMTQLGVCFSELCALVDVCSKQACGETPDISVMLGFKEPSHGDEFSSAAVQAQSLSQLSDQLHELRKHIDKLRAHICNKYAEDMGNSLHCATQ